MADIFISYASDERDRIRPIADALEAHGFSVWWDSHLRAGETFDEVIEREIEAAACVIVAWSSLSVSRRWVRTEANEGLDRDALIPVALDKVKPPIAFRLVQTEDFSDWNGDTNAKCWQRLILQVDALVAKARGRATDPAPDVEDVPESMMKLVRKTAKSPSEDTPPSSARGALPTLLSFVAAGLISIGIALLIQYGLTQFAGLKRGLVTASLASSFAFAALIFFLFDIADHELDAKSKALARRWLLPVNTGLKVTSAEAFHALFVATFGSRHISLKCIWRSALASIMALLVLTALLYFVFELQPDDVQIGDFRPKGFVALLSITAVIFMLPNIFGDYVSLFQTRLFLRFLKRFPSAALPVVIVDFVLTGVIFLAAISLFLPVIVIITGEGGNQRGFFEIAQSIVAGIIAYVEEFISRGHVGSEDLLIGLMAGAAVLTTYLTSFWLWIVLILAPLARAFLWNRSSGPSTLGAALRVQRKPFTALGTVIAALICVIGLVLTGALAILAR